VLTIASSLAVADYATAARHGGAALNEPVLVVLPMAASCASALQSLGPIH